MTFRLSLFSVRANIRGAEPSSAANRNFIDVFVKTSFSDFAKSSAVPGGDNQSDGRTRITARAVADAMSLIFYVATALQNYNQRRISSMSMHAQQHISVATQMSTPLTTKFMHCLIALRLIEIRMHFPPRTILFFSAVFGNFLYFRFGSGKQNGLSGFFYFENIFKESTFCDS